MSDEIKSMHSQHNEDADAAAADGRDAGGDDKSDAASDTTTASKNVPQTFSGAFSAEAAKGNLILLSAILSGFGIFFTRPVFWLTFAIIAFEAYISVTVPAYGLQGMSKAYVRNAKKGAARLRAGKFIFLGIPLLAVLSSAEVSVSRPELCNDTCIGRAKLALYLGLGSLLVLETLAPLVELVGCAMRGKCGSSDMKAASRREYRVFGKRIGSPSDASRALALIISHFCSGVSICISGIVLLIIGGSYAVFMGWQSFLLCWAVLATEALVEGVLRAEVLPQWLERWRLLLGGLLRLVVHVTAFAFLFSKYKHLRYATPALDTTLCDVTCQSRLQEMLTALMILTCIQWIYALYGTAWSVIYVASDPGEITRRRFKSGELHSFEQLKEMLLRLIVSLQRL
jgi:hypothetical protein